MTKKKVLSNMLAVLAMLAVSMTTMTLTACGDDDDDTPTPVVPTTEVSIYKQWELTGKSEDFTSEVYDFSEQGKMTLYVKFKAEKAAMMGVSADKYYIGGESACTITINADGKSGAIKVSGSDALKFEDLSATMVTIDGLAFRALKEKVVGEMMPE